MKILTFLYLVLELYKLLVLPLVLAPRIETLLRWFSYVY